jgi:5-methylcytosine-specific restriction endonuclease McrA
MPKARKSLAKPRSIAFIRQSGHCFYCNQPMCAGNIPEFSKQYKISSSQAKLLCCTGEHLTAFVDGGSSAPTNIVAACWYCNLNRHRRKHPPEPEQYKELVHKRMSKGGWHGIRLN